MRRGADWYGFLVALAVAVLIVGGIYVRAKAPCSWFALSTVKDVPARCLVIGHR